MYMRVSKHEHLQIDSDFIPIKWEKHNESINGNAIKSKFGTNHIEYKPHAD